MLSLAGDSAAPAFEEMVRYRSRLEVSLGIPWSSPIPSTSSINARIPIWYLSQVELPVRLSSRTRFVVMIDAEARPEFRMETVRSIEAMKLADSGMEASSYLREGGGAISGIAEDARRAHGGSGKHIGRSCCGRPRSYPEGWAGVQQATRGQ